MNNRLLPSSFALLTLVVASVCMTSPLHAVDQRPNILLMYTDDQAQGSLGFAGNDEIKTPHMDAPARRGIYFENAHVSTSTCWVSRACLFTGCYERRHLYRIKPGSLDPALCETSYFTLLKNSGYRTGHIGKEHVALADESAEAMFDVRRRLSRNPYFKKRPDGSLRHETDILGDWGMEFIDQQPNGQPFCLTISFNAPHAEDKGIADNTVIIYWADNGYYLGDRGVAGK